VTCPFQIAVVGCGVISRTYAHTISQFDFMELAACADADAERAEKLAARFGSTARSPADVLADPGIDAVVNLTPPLAHEAVSRAALAAGKATFSEKPLGVELAEGQALVDLAAAGHLALGCAPDTFLGVGLQTARAAIDRGDIGEPLAANAFMLGSGPESWHPNPTIFYRRGAGPLLDMGPYYLTTLVQLLGPARSISASARISRAQRPILSEPMRGQLIDVEVPTHVGSLVEFASGPIASLVTSFDVQATRYHNIEVYGTEGTMSVPNPNTFDGPVRIRRTGDEAWTDLDLLPAHLPQQRGIGLADMIWAQRTGRSHRASGALALHVLELMTGALVAAGTGRRFDLTTTCDRAAPLPTGLAPNTFDD
jgi:predicted dehydrogenase